MTEQVIYYKINIKRTKQTKYYINVRMITTVAEFKRSLYSTYMSNRVYDAIKKNLVFDYLLTLHCHRKIKLILDF